MLEDWRSKPCSIWQLRGELLPFHLSSPRPHPQPVRAGEWRAGGRREAGERREGGPSAAREVGGREGRARAGVSAGKPGANVDNRLEVSPGEPPSPPLQRPGRSGSEEHRPGLPLPVVPQRRLLTPALRGRPAGDGSRVQRRPPQTSSSEAPTNAGAPDAGQA